MIGNNLLYPHGELSGTAVLIDLLGDLQRRLNRCLGTLNADDLHWQVDPETNSIAVILWHMGRLTDVFHTRLALGLPSEVECWFQRGWAHKTGYDPRGLGREGWGSLNDYTREEVIAIPKFSKTQIAGYLDDVYTALRETLNTASWTLLAKPGVGFEGRFTCNQIISMALMDNVRHLGEIYLIKSLRKNP